MNLRDLKYFTCVAETGSFSLAANLLHRSQPAVSRAIQELESDLGVSLFTRHGRRISVSPEGWSLLRDAKSVLESADVLLDRARMLAAGKSAVLRLGAATSTIERVLPPLVNSFREAWPQVELKFTAGSGGEMLDALVRGEVDAVFTRLTASETLVSRWLFPLHVIAVVPEKHAIARHKSVSVNDLAHHSLLAAPPEFTSRMLFDSACLAARLRPRIVLESHDHNALVALAEVGYGVAIVPSTVAMERHRVKAVSIQVQKRLLGVWTGLVWDRQRLTPVLKAFIDAATTQLRDDYPGVKLKLSALPRA
jgi:DNA-binding transcriptional LysR family regulator